MFVKVHLPLQDQDPKQELVKEVEFQEGNKRSREESTQEEPSNITKDKADIMLDNHILM